MHRVGSRLELPSGEYRFRGAEVSRIAGKPTTGDQHPDAGVGAESVGDGVPLDADQLRRVTKAPVAVADIAGPALRVHLADPNEHVDVGVVRAVHQLDDGVSVHAEVVGEGRPGEAQHIGARGQPAVVAVTAVG